jgi:hypothetical protein
MIGVPYENRFLKNLPDYYTGENDEKARGIRNKKARYTEKVEKILNMTARAIGWGNIKTYLPEMPPVTMEQYTQTAGWSALIKKDEKYHLVSEICAGFIGEWTEYFIPQGVIVSNPYAAEKIDGQYYFGKDAVLLRNDTYMRGLYPIICPRAEMMCENDVSILCGLENLRIINIIHALNDSMKTAAESFFKQIRFGRSGIITGKDSRNKWSGGDNSPVIENLPTGGVPANYMIQFIETAQYIKGSLYNDIGLQYNSNMKRESLNDAETTMNSDVLRPLIDDMLECRKQFCKDCKETFGIDIKPPELQGAWKIRKEMTEQNARAEPEQPEENAEPETEPERGAEDENNN